MGFERKRYKLTFDESTGYGGLEVLTRPPSMGVLLRLEGLQAGAMKGNTEDLSHLTGLFAQLIVSWNVTEDGEPVPVTEETVCDDMAMFMAIVSAFAGKVAALSTVPPPLPGGSGTGQASPVIPRIPVTPLPDPEETTGPETTGLAS